MRPTSIGTALLRLRASCPHDATVTVENAKAGDLESALQGSNLVVEGITARQCSKCGLVIDAGGPSWLRPALRALGAVLPAEAAARLDLAKDFPPKRVEQAAVPRVLPPNTAADVTPYIASAARFRLADVILPAATSVALDEALIKVLHHKLIYETWGFGKIDSGGKGVTLVLYGPPGTGKTRSAEALAGELGRPFLSLSAGDLESRFMGETAKNVQAVFRAATEQGAVLFFDEADSLFGRRASDVTQGVDHEVNVTKSTLLIEVERFEGILVLATNFQENIDGAFVRRLSWHVHFRKPDHDTRRRLWELHLVPGIPLAEDRAILIDHIAEESEGLSGGDILTSLRIALPMAIRELGPTAARLERRHLDEAVRRTLQARRDVGVRPAPKLTRDIAEALMSPKAAADPVVSVGDGVSHGKKEEGKS